MSSLKIGRCTINHYYYLFNCYYYYSSSYDYIILHVLNRSTFKNKVHFKIFIIIYYYYSLELSLLLVVLVLLYLSVHIVALLKAK